MARILLIIAVVFSTVVHSYADAPVQSIFAAEKADTMETASMFETAVSSADRDCADSDAKTEMQFSYSMDCQAVIVQFGYFWKRVLVQHSVAFEHRTPTRSTKVDLRPPIA